VGIKHSGDVRCNIVATRISLEDGAKFESSIDINANARGANKPIQQATV
jgi:hypothetical protein